MLYSLSLSFLYQRDKEAVLLWNAVRGLFPWNHYITFLGFHQVNEIICGEISLVQQYMIGNAFEEISADKKENQDIWSSLAIPLITVT